MKRELSLRARLFTIVASGAALASCDRSGTEPVAPTPSPQPEPVQTSEPIAEPTPPSEEPTPTATATATTTAPPAGTPVASHPPPHPAQTCAKPERRCFEPNTGMGGQMEPSPGEFDKNGCLSGDRVSGHCQGFYAQKGPTFDGKQCCYVGCGGPAAPCGRPVLVAGEPRVATARARDDWQVDFAELAERAHDLPLHLKRELARAWQADGLLEHASVAAFSRFVLELMAVAAPARLIEETIVAARDEVEHAKLCFGLARAFDESACGPGTFDFTGVFARSDLNEIVSSVVEEACCGETVGALLAARQLEQATDPAVRHALARIADDEARHAELGWSFVTWAIRNRPALGRVVCQAFDRGIARLHASSVPDAEPRARAFGRLTRAEVQQVIENAIRQVIRPTAAQLLQNESEHVGKSPLLG